MPEKRTASSPVYSDHYFGRELAGENPPSFLALRKLYDLSSQLLVQEPWNLLGESQLVLLSSSAGNELCYCTVMGALGQVYAMHAYIGPDSLRTFRKILAGETLRPQEFFAFQRSVSLEFVTRGELEKPDRELLAALGHTHSRASRCPIFRAIRPGFYPWFVSAEEAQLLTECVQAVSLVCSAIAGGSGAGFWNVDQDVHPFVSHVPSRGSDYRIEPVKILSSPEPSPVPVRVEEAALRKLAKGNYARGGVMELDHQFINATVGKKSERKALTCVALAVDAKSGIIYSQELTDARQPPADVLAQVFLKGVESTGVFPAQVNVRHVGFRDSLQPLLQSLNVAIRVHRKLPALDEAWTAMNAFLGN